MEKKPKNAMNICDICLEQRPFQQSMWNILCCEGHSCCHACWIKIRTHFETCPYCRRQLLYVRIKDRSRNLLCMEKWQQFCLSIHKDMVVEIKDKHNRWHTAKILKIFPTTLHVHFIGWSDKWNEIVPRHYTHVQALNTYIRPSLMQWKDELEEGKEVEYCLVQHGHRRWHHGTILSILPSGRTAMVTYQDRSMKIKMYDLDIICPLYTHTKP